MPTHAFWFLAAVLCLSGCRAAAVGTRVEPPSSVGRAGESALINLDGGSLINLDGGSLRASGVKKETCLARAVSGLPVTAAAPGEPLAVTVESSRQGLRFSWQASEGLVSEAAAGAVTWTVPERPGRHTLQVTVTDDQGASVPLAWEVVVTPAGATVTPPAPGTCP